ncbi:hypothetical protein [Mesorhizobium sp. A623]
MIAETGPKSTGRKEAQERILIESLECETRLYETGMSEPDFVGCRRILGFEVGFLRDRLIVEIERQGDGWYVVDVRKGFYLHSVSDIVITDRQREIITKMADDKALAGFKISERQRVDPTPSVDMTLNPFRRPVPPAFMRSKPEGVRVANPDACGEEIKGYWTTRGTGPGGRVKTKIWVDAHSRGPKKRLVAA